MNETLTNQESKEATPESLFGLPRPIAGGVVGVLLFLFLVLIFSIWDTESGFLQAAVLAPGYLAMMFFHMDAPIILFLIPSFPPAIIGSLIVSKKKALRVSGIVVLVIYLAVSIPLGIIARIFTHIVGDF